MPQIIKLTEIRPSEIVLAYWKQLLVIEEDAEIFETLYIKEAVL